MPRKGSKVGDHAKRPASGSRGRRKDGMATKARQQDVRVFKSSHSAAVLHRGKEPPTMEGIPSAAIRFYKSRAS